MPGGRTATVDIALRLNLSEITGQINALKAAFKNIGNDSEIGKNLKNEIQQAISAAEKLQNELESVKLGKVSSTKFNNTINDINSEIYTLQARTTALESAMTSLISGLSSADGGKFTGMLEEMRSAMSSTITMATQTADALQGINEAVGKNANIKITDTKELADSTKQLQEYISILNKANDMEYNLSEKLFNSKSAEVRIKQFKNLANALSEYQKKLSSMDETDSNYLKVIEEASSKAKQFSALQNKIYDAIGDDGKFGGINVNTIDNFAKQGMVAISELESLARKHLSNLNDELQTLGGTTEKGGGLSLDIPINFSQTTGDIVSKVTKAINAANKIVSAHPIELEIQFTSAWGTKKNRGLLKQFQEKVNDMNEGPAKAEFQSLIDDINKGFGNALNVKIDTSELDDANEKIRSLISDIKTQLNDEALKDFSIELTKVTISDDVKAALQNDLTDIGKNLKIVIDNIELGKNANISELQTALSNIGQTISSPRLSGILKQIHEANQDMDESKYKYTTTENGKTIERPFTSLERKIFASSKSGWIGNPFYAGNKLETPPFKRQLEKAQKAGADIGIHTHPQKIASMSYLKDSDFEVAYNYYKKGIKKSVISGQKYSEIFDAGGFFEKYKKKVDFENKQVWDDLSHQRDVFVSSYKKRKDDYSLKFLNERLDESGYDNLIGKILGRYPLDKGSLDKIKSKGSIKDQLNNIIADYVKKDGTWTAENVIKTLLSNSLSEKQMAHINKNKLPLQLAVSDSLHGRLKDIGYSQDDVGQYYYGKYMQEAVEKAWGKYAKGIGKDLEDNFLKFVPTSDLDSALGMDGISQSASEASSSVKTLGSALEEITSLLGEIKTGSGAFDGLKDIFGDSTEIKSMASSLTSLLEVIEKVSGVSSSASLDKMFSGMTESVKTMGRSKKALQDIIEQYDKYVKAGGTKDITELSSGKKTQEKLSAGYSKLLKDRQIDEQSTLLAQAAMLAAAADRATKSAQQEASALDNVASSASAAAISKKGFIVANEGVGDSAVESSGKIDQENDSMQSLIQRANAALSKDNKYRDVVPLTDENGNIVISYRGVEEAFGASHSNVFAGNFSTSSIANANYYASTKNSKAYKGLLRFKNPLEINAKGKRWNNVEYLGRGYDDASGKITEAREKIDDVLRSFYLVTGEQYELNEMLSDISDIDSEIDTKGQYTDLLQKMDFAIKSHTEDSGELSDLKNQFIDAYKTYMDISSDDSNPYGTHYTNKVVELAKQHGYDGVIFKNIIDGIDAEKDVFVSLSDDQFQILDILDKQTLQRESVSELIRDNVEKFGEYRTKGIASEPNLQILSDIQKLYDKAYEETERYFNDASGLEDEDYTKNRFLDYLKEYSKNHKIDLSPYKDFYDKNFDSMELGYFDDDELADFYKSFNEQAYDARSKLIDEILNIRHSGTLEEVDSEISSAIDSASYLEDETSAFKSISTAAADASEGKSKFASANAEVLSSITSSLAALNSEGKGFESLNKLINNLGGKNGDAKLQATVEGLKQIQNILNTPVTESGFIDALSKFDSEKLKNISDVLKNTKNLDKAQKAVNGESGAIPFEDTIEKDQKILEAGDNLTKSVKSYVSALMSVASGEANMADTNVIMQMDEAIQKLANDTQEASSKLDTMSNVAQTAQNKFNDTLAGEFDKQFSDYSKKIEDQIGKAEATRKNQRNAYTEEQVMAITEVRQNLEAINALRASHNQGQIWDPSELQQVASLMQRIGTLMAGLNDNTKILAKTGDVDNELGKLRKMFADNSLSGDLKAEVVDLINYLEQVRVSANGAEDGLSQLSKVQMGAVKDRVKELNQEMYKSEQNGKGFWKQFSGAITSQSANFLAQYFSLQDFIRYGREIIDTVTQIDSALIELQKVSDASDSRIAQSFETSAQTAQDYGATISDIIRATSDWARLGYSVDESEELARVTQLYRNVGDNISQQEASESLTATLKGFQLEADDAELVVDKFNEVANNFAIDTYGIGQALERSAASFYTSGTDLSKSIALVTTANTVLQNPETVGTVFKTLSARIRGSKTELQELGEEEDEFTKSTSTLQGLVKGLTGFDIMKDKDTYKDIFDILVGIGDEWQNLTDIERASLGEALAGKRNSNALFAVLNNIDLLKEAYMTAENAAGSAAREEEHYEQSVEYRINQAKASLQELMYDFMGSDFLVGAIKGANEFLQIIDSIVEHLGTFGSLLAGFSLMDIFKGFAGGNSVIAEFFKYFAGTGQTGTFMGDVKKVFGGVFENNAVKEGAETAGKVAGDVLTESAAEATSEAGGKIIKGIFPKSLVKEGAEDVAEEFGEEFGESAAKKMAPAASAGLMATLSPMLIAGGIIAAGTAAAAIGYSMYEEHIKKQISDATSEANKITASSENIDAQIARVQELRDKLASGTLSEQESYNAKSELLSIQESLIGSYDSLAGRIDLVNGGLEKQKSLLEGVSKSEYSDFLNKNGEQIKNATKFLESETSQAFGSRSIDTGVGTARLFGISESDKNFKDLKKIVDKYDSLNLTEIGNGQFQVGFNGDWLTADQDLNDFLTDLNKFSMDVGGNISDSFQNVWDDARKYYSEVVTPRIGENKPLYDQAKEYRLALNDTGDQLRKDYEDAAKSYNEAIAGIGDTTLNQAESNFNTLHEQVLGFIADYPEFASIFEGIYDSVNLSSASTAKFKQQLENTNTGLGKMAETIKEDGISVEDMFDILTGRAEEYYKVQEGSSERSRILKDIDPKEFDNLGNVTKEDIDLVFKLADAFGILSEDGVAPSSEQIDDFTNAMKSMGFTFEEAESKIKNIDLSGFRSEMQKELSHIDSVNAALVNSFSGKGLSYSFDEDGNATGDFVAIANAFKDLPEYHSGQLFIRTANGIRVSTKELRKLQAQQKAITKQKFLEKQKELTDQLTAAELANQAAKEKGISDRDLPYDLDSIRAAIEEVNMLAATYDGATSAYQQWLDAQSGGEMGDMYDNIQSNAFSRGDELLKNNLVGTEEFRAIAELLSGEDLSTASAAEVVAAYQGIDTTIANTSYTLRDFFKESTEGTDNFARALADLGFADLEGDVLSFNKALNTAEIAEALGTSVDVVESLFGKLHDRGADFVWMSDAQYKRLEDANAALIEAKNNLDGIEFNGKPLVDSLGLPGPDEIENAEDAKEAIDDINRAINSRHANWSEEELSAMKAYRDVLSEIYGIYDSSSGTAGGRTVTGLKSAYDAVGVLENQITALTAADIPLQVGIENDKEAKSAIEAIANSDKEIKIKLGLDEDDTYLDILSKIEEGTWKPSQEAMIKAFGEDDAESMATLKQILNDTNNIEFQENGLSEIDSQVDDLITKAEGPHYVNFESNLNSDKEEQNKPSNGKNLHDVVQDGSDLRNPINVRSHDRYNANPYQTNEDLAKRQRELAQTSKYEYGTNSINQFGDALNEAAESVGNIKTVTEGMVDIEKKNIEEITKLSEGRRAQLEDSKQKTAAKYQEEITDVNNSKVIPEMAKTLAKNFADNINDISLADLIGGMLESSRKETTDDEVILGVKQAGPTNQHIQYETTPVSQPKPVFGNIDLNNRQSITWTKETLDQYRDNLKTLFQGATDATINEMEGTVSTVLGASGEYDGVEIAYSPMLQTEHGPVVLSQGTVDKYITGLLQEVGSGKGQWTTEDLLALDKKGLDIDGQHISGLVADVGETARQTGESMHLVEESAMRASNHLSDAATKTGNAFGGAKVLKNLKKVQDSIANTVDNSQTAFQESTPNIEEAIEAVSDVSKNVGADIGRGMSSTLRNQTENVTENTTVNKVKTVFESAGAAAGAGIQDGVQHIRQEVDQANLDTTFEGTMHITPEVEQPPNPDDGQQHIDRDYDPPETVVANASQGVDRYISTDVSTTAPTAIQGVIRTIIQDVPTTVASAVQNVIRVVSGAIGASYRGTVTNSGGAFARGSISSVNSNLLNDKQNQTKKKETALTGELGRELVVYGNQWWTVGDNGAEFTTIPKGSVVFDAEQTEQLLNKGHISGRGRAYLSGTAYLRRNDTGSYVGGGTFTLGNPWVGTSSAPAQSYDGGGAPTYSDQGVSNAESVADSTSDAAEAADEFKETLDEIEILLDRVDREIEHIDRTAQGAYNTFTSRNSAISKELGVITTQINNQMDGYKRYIEQANSVGLDDVWAEKVRNGAINIEDVTDEDLWDKIQSFQEYYEKALDCLDAVDDLKDTQADLDKQRFDNLQTQFEDLIQEIESAKDMLNAFIDLTEEEGHLVAAEYYTALIRRENQELAKLTKEREALNEELVNAISKGRIQIGSEDFYEMQQAIDEVSKSIVEAQKNLVEFQNSIRQLDWDRFDMGIDWVDDLVDELEFLNELLDTGNAYDKEGNVTDEGIARFGTMAMDYDTQMRRAQKYADQIKKINADLAKDPNNLTLIDRKRELIKAQQESISAAKKEKEAIRDLVKDGIEKQIDALSKLIDEYTNALDNDSSMQDYARQISEQQKEIDKYRKQVQSWSGDDSEEGAARRQKTAEELRKAEDELAQTQEDQRISAIKESLTELQDNFSEVINSRLDDIDALLAEVITGVNMNAGTINSTITSEAANVGYNISTNLSTALSTAESALEKALGTNNADNKTALLNLGNKFQTIVSGFAEGKFDNTQATILRSIEKIFSDVDLMAYNAKVEANKRIAEENRRKAEEVARQKAAQKAAAQKKAQQEAAKKAAAQKKTQPANNNNNNNKGSGAKLTDSIKHGVAAAIWNGNMGWGSDPERARKLTEVFGPNNGIQAIVNTGADMMGNPNGYSYLEMRRKFRGYAKGIKKIDHDQIAITQEQGREYIMKDGKMLTPLSAGDSVFNKLASDNLWNFANAPEDFIKSAINSARLPELQYNIMASGGNDVSVTFNLPNVIDSRSFMQEIQHNNQFIQFVQEVSLGQASGHGKLVKNGIRF